MGFLSKSILFLAFAFTQIGYCQDLQFSYALEQMEAKEILKRNLTGKGIKIGIIDGGFLDADELIELRHFFTNESVKWYKDYVTPEMPKYGGSVGLKDDHGTEVWKMIGGLNEETKIQFGLATNATYYLARTDHGGYEKREEEEYMVHAIEQMTDMGVDIINISLGFNSGYTESQQNYRISDMDGKTTLVAKAVDEASKKGVLVVVAAGNEAQDSNWQIVSSPGDAKLALTVGASKFNIWDKMDYSSIGPDFTTFLKPNISVYASGGTSFSAPAITGLAACLLEYDSTLTNTQLIELLEKAGHFYPFGNNYVGNGVPTASRIFQLLAEKHLEKSTPIISKSDRFKFSPSSGKTVVVYHKKDKWNVLHRINYFPGKKKILISRPENTHYSTILDGQEVLEIKWVN